MVFSGRSRAYWISQRMARAMAPLGADLDGDLVVRATDATALDLDVGGFTVVDGLAEDLDGVLLGLLRDDLEGTKDDLLGDRFLAVVHHAADVVDLRD
jgi:hypothetical protein